MGVNQSFNAIFGFRRHTGKYTLTGGAWESAYPLANLSNSEFARGARSVDLGEESLQIIGTAAAGYSIRMMGIAAHNMTLAAEYRLELYRDTDLTSLLYDSKWQSVWPAPYTYTGRSWYEPFFWTGGYGTDETEGQIPFCPILLPQVYAAPGLRLRFRDPTNPEGKLFIGMLEITNGLQARCNFDFGAQYGYTFFTETRQLRGGLERHSVLPPGYVFNGQIPYLEEEEAQNGFMEMLRQYGKHTPFMWMPYPEKPQLWLRNSKLVTFANPGLMAHSAPLRHSFPIALKEFKG